MRHSGALSPEFGPTLHRARHGTHLDLHAVTRPVHTRARNEGPPSFHNHGEGPPISWLLPVFVKTDTYIA